VIKGIKNSTEWFYHYFSHRDITPYLTRQGAGRFKLTKSTLADIPCAIPPTKAEQEAISTALSDAEALTESLQQLITKKHQVNRGVMQNLLNGRVRLPGFTGKWRLRQIKEVAAHSSEKNTSGEYLTVLTCSKRLGFVESIGYFKNQVFSRDTRGYKIIKRGQIGYPSNHIEEGSIGLQNIYDAALVSPIYVVFSVAEEVDSYFLYKLLKLDYYRHQFARATSSSVDRRGSLRWPTFSEITVRLPEIEEQTAIVTMLKDMEAEVSGLEAKLTKARQIKQGMMQALLTGRIRLV
jgi:type I restriction enzyme S subunit